jgi:hypothetical protein
MRASDMPTDSKGKDYLCQNHVSGDNPSSDALILLLVFSPQKEPFVKSNFYKNQAKIAVKH